MSLRQFAVLVAGSLAAMPAFSLAARAETRSAAPPIVSGPVVHANVAVYLLRGKSATGPVPLTLEEALRQRTIEVHETGSVQELRIENKGDAPVFVQLGDIVKGGRQDRVLSVSLLLQPRSGLVPIGAYCVEQGRWSARGTEDVRRFALSEALLPSREAKVAIAKPQGGAGGTATAGLTRTPRTPIEAELEGRRLRQAVDELARRADADVLLQQQRTPARPPLDGQSEVWRSVDALQRDLSARLAAPVASDTSRTSLQLSLENEKLKAAQDAFVAALEPKALVDDDVLGVAVAIGGRITNADLYPSNGLFRKMWPKLVRAAATEALAERSAAVAAPPAVADIEAFLAAAARGEASERQLGVAGRIETREAPGVLRVRALAGVAAAAVTVHESYLAK